VMIGVDAAHEAELNRWYDEEHFPERMAVPGLINGRRFTALEGTPKYLATYDLESPEVLHSEPYRKIATRTPWTERLAQHFKPSVRNVYREIRPPATNGKHLRGERPILVVIDVAPAHEAELNRWYDEE